MEAIGLAASCLTIAGCAYTIIKDLHDLRAKYKQADGVIDTLCVQVSTLRSAVFGLSSWMERRPLSAAQETGLRLELRQALDACGTLISAIQQHLLRVKGNSETISARGKLRHILGEDDLKEYNRMLSLQVQALSFLVQVIQLDSSKDRRRKFSRAEHQQLLTRAKDDASTFSSRDITGESITGNSLYITSGSTDFDFDDELIRSKPYLRTFKEVMRRTIRKKTTQGTPNVNKILRTSGDPARLSSAPRSSGGQRRSRKSANNAGYRYSALSQNNPERNLEAATETEDGHVTIGPTSTIILAEMSTFSSSLDLVRHQTRSNASFDRIIAISETSKEYEARVLDDSDEYEDVTGRVLNDLKTEVYNDGIGCGASTTNTKEFSERHTGNSILELPESCTELDHARFIAQNSTSQSYMFHQAKWHVGPNRGSLTHAPSIERLQNVVSEGTIDINNIQPRVSSFSPKASSNYRAPPVSELPCETGAKNALLTIQTGIEKNCLHRTIQFGEVEHAKDLITLGIDVNSQDIDGRSPLHYACESMFVANVAAIELLLNAGAYIDLVDGKGFTPLDEACRRAPPKTICFLLQKGAIVRRSSYEMLKLCQHRSDAQQRIIEKALIQHNRPVCRT